jgi:hypothetical protein
LDNWRKAGAQIAKIGSGELAVPKIFAPPTSKTDLGTVLMATTFHVEELSGLEFVSQPENFDQCHRLGHKLSLKFSKNLQMGAY